MVIGLGSREFLRSPFRIRQVDLGFDKHDRSQDLRMESRTLTSHIRPNPAPWTLGFVITRLLRTAGLHVQVIHQWTPATF